MLGSLILLRISAAQRVNGLAAAPHLQGAIVKSVVRNDHSTSGISKWRRGPSGRVPLSSMSGAESTMVAFPRFLSGADFGKVDKRQVGKGFWPTYCMQMWLIKLVFWIAR